MKPSNRMLSGEIVASLFALGYALIALQPDGYLQKLLLRNDGWIGVLTWSLFIGIPAFTLLVVNVREWSRPASMQGAIWRSRLVLIQGLSWLYAVHIMVSTGRGYSLLMVHAVVGVFFCAWSYIENRRVRREIRLLANPA